MDGTLFDALIKRLGTTRVSRLTALRGLAVVAVARGQPVLACNCERRVRALTSVVARPSAAITSAPLRGNRFAVN